MIFEDVDFSATQKSRGVKYVISGINWTMFRVGIDDYSTSLSRLIQGMKEQGNCCKLVINLFKILWLHTHMYTPYIVISGLYVHVHCTNKYTCRLYVLVADNTCTLSSCMETCTCIMC